MVYTKDTRPVRRGEEIDERTLESFLRKKIELPEGNLQVRQFGAGHSNLTYELSIGDEWKAVLRRPPMGPVAPKAHDMEREYKVLQALYPIFPLAPKPYLYESGEIIGRPFFLMERREGIVFDQAFPEGVEATPELGRQLSETMVDKLVELHSLNYRETPLKDMVKPDGFMERQVHGWIKRYERAGTDDVVSGERLKKWLTDHIPAAQGASIIHYDYKLNNAMFHQKHPSQMIGLFDWEMTTVGDPLADVGAALSYWIQQDDPELLKTGLGKSPVTVFEGFYTREEFIHRYAAKSGRDVKEIDYYLTFAYFKLAGIIQQIYFRYKQGQTRDPRFANMNTFVNNLIQHAEETAGL
ncbi:phosphotransferase family protein [Halobacillus karajensis]|uniref:Aminoglycoside phosphotransferase n=1 Tax=Halobacillus karajensis TaxID=195088 RepID=A0A024P5I0_9BACI|nr:phosphotransferase family protein [Halobacillus karajensis]CDQ20498.1 Putative aminoglycoside phosphotransferase [Halobacillus karajensis]CDQ24033.1 Putative aminoglycoside phosphotransferase [Halobacillus karajensis]CDQ27511.1 Putative aminoglycoside phosphotransferase [Halobacillus karajensis]